MEDGKQAIDTLRSRFAEAVVSDGEYRGQHWAVIRRDALIDVCEWLRDAPECAYDLLLDVTALHWPDDAEPFEVVYHLYSRERNDRLRLKTRAGADGSVPSVTSVWDAANWNERETYDMFGIRFEGHPDLRRILMPEEYTDHPLRKEFPLFRG